MGQHLGFHSNFRIVALSSRWLPNYDDNGPATLGVSLAAQNMIGHSIDGLDRILMIDLLESMPNILDRSMEPNPRKDGIPDDVPRIF